MRSINAMNITDALKSLNSSCQNSARKLFLTVVKHEDKHFVESHLNPVNRGFLVLQEVSSCCTVLLLL